MNTTLRRSLFICGLFNGAVNSSDYTRHIIGRTVSNELKEQTSTNYYLACRDLIELWNLSMFGSNS
jgi:hypothetical protein